MSIRVACPSCGSQLNAPTHLVGRQAACGKCGTWFPVDVAHAVLAPPPPSTPVASPKAPPTPEEAAEAEAAALLLEEDE
jgi:hypothetical protein